METQDARYERLKEVCTQCGKSYSAGTRLCPVDGMELMSTMADPLIGVVLPRRYRVQSLLGRGSMSVVYKGVYEPLDQPVAIKMLKSHLVSDHQQAKRFQQEIKTAGGLNHPNIVGILDFGVTEQGVPYLVMDYLEGKSLSDVLQKEERISVNRVVRVFSQAADALGYAHALGVIHRDIKPSNLVLQDNEDEKDITKIVDFGIAKVMAHDGLAGGTLGLTATGEVLGTPLYMSPEQANGRELDWRSDIYSLGCVMYHAITGRPPFIGDTALDTIRLQITGTPAPIETARPDLYIPERLQSVINKALQKDPKMRYQHMEHLKADLETCARRADLSNTVTLRISSSSIEAPPVEFSEEQTKRSMKLPAICAALAIGVAVGVSAWAMYSNQSAKGPEAKAAVQAPSNDVQWRDNLMQAQAAFAAGKYAESQKLFATALADSQKFKQPDTRTAVTLAAAANTSLAMGNLEEASRDCQKALDIYAAASPRDTGRAEVYATLSKLYLQQGDQQRAEQYARQSLELREQYLGPNHHDVAMSVAALAAAEALHGDYGTADGLLTNALAINERAIGPEHPDTAAIVAQLAAVRQKEQKYDSAEQLFNRALSIQQKYLGVNHPAVADTLCALGLLELKVRNDASAETMFKNALAIRQKVFGPQSPQVAEVNHDLELFYAGQKK